ncbi:MAG: hypothetical protein ACRDSJ_08305 [Rubrobacteraceae bacterium]
MSKPASPEFDLVNPVSSAASVLRAAVLSPRQFFLNFQTEGPIKEPAVFALLVGLLSGVVSLLAAPIFEFLFGSGSGEVWGLPLFGALAFALLSPAFVALMAAVYLLSVRTFVGKVGDFRGMFRMAAYAYAAMVFAWVPFIGAFAITYSLMVVMGVGVRFVHRTTFLTALVASLTSYLPLALVLIALRGVTFQLTSL